MVPSTTAHWASSRSTEAQPGRKRQAWFGDTGLKFRFTGQKQGRPQQGVEGLAAWHRLSACEREVRLGSQLRPHSQPYPTAPEGMKHKNCIQAKALGEGGRTYLLFVSKSRFHLGTLICSKVQTTKGFFSDQDALNSFFSGMREVGENGNCKVLTLLGSFLRVH